MTPKNSRKLRTPIRDRKLPEYSKGEEVFNMVTHIAGSAFAVLALILCVVFAALHKNPLGILSGILYGTSMIIVYVISSVYHGLNPKRAGIGKRVMQVLDHCDIYGLIIGTFAPIVFSGLRKANPLLAWISFGIVCLVSVIGIVFTAIDFKKYKVVSYGAYFVAGWSVLMTVREIYRAFPPEFLILLITGGAVYTLGMIFFALGSKKHKYCHSIFHLFILAGSIIQFIPIFKYCF